MVELQELCLSRKCSDRGYWLTVSTDQRLPTYATVSTTFSLAPAIAPVNETPRATVLIQVFLPKFFFEMLVVAVLLIGLPLRVASFPLITKWQ